MPTSLVADLLLPPMLNIGTFITIYDKLLNYEPIGLLLRRKVGSAPYLHPSTIQILIATQGRGMRHSFKLKHEQTCLPHHFLKIAVHSQLRSSSLLTLTAFIYHPTSYYRTLPILPTVTSSSIRITYHVNDGPKS